MSSHRMQQVKWLILRALVADSRDGAGLLTAIGVRLPGPRPLYAGTLFSALWHLRADGLIAVDREEVVDQRLRRYYRLTLAGQERLAALPASGWARQADNPQNERRSR